MANQEHLQIIRQGVDVWNKWRQKHPEIRPDLTKADLRCNILDDERLYDPTLNIHANDRNLMTINLRKATLTGIDLTHACLHKADLREADLSDARLIGTNFCWADLRDAILNRADLHRANLNHADLTGADLTDAILERAILVNTTVSRATFTGCRVYGASAWDLVGMDEDIEQQNLIITASDEPDKPKITVDDIEVAQFVYLLLNYKKIRNVINTITSKAVLILGRFSKKRKGVLDAIRNEFRKPEYDYVPIVFDFPPARNQTTIETIKTLAGMARFVIADLTDARSVLQELQAIVPDFPSLAVRLMIKRSQHEYGMLDFTRRFPCVIKPTYEYDSLEEMIHSVKENIIDPAEAKVKELRQSD